MQYVRFSRKLLREEKVRPFMSETTKRWLNAWGYSERDSGLHQLADAPPASHAYRNELEELLDPDGPIQASAVFDVEGVPTLCFVEDNGRFSNAPSALNQIREKIWNQNLISVFLVLRDGSADAVPVGSRDLKPERLPWEEAHSTGIYSKRDFQSGEVFRRHSAWFNPEERVERDLLQNLDQIIKDLKGFGLEKVDAQYLMAQVLFVSYLEHRKIVGERYRSKHNINSLEDLILAGNRRGVVRLLVQLKKDFNGDFLEPKSGDSDLWEDLPDGAIRRLGEFLSRTDLKSDQLHLWRYDFRFIPVELLSGIYESFLADEQRDVGAYYTPRHLANLVVDRAFAESGDILSEKIYDGACGSGILLTTAYRRMLSYAAAKKQRSLSFNERRDLLRNHIFGSDLNLSACRVTAFSLYLSMLEGLQPADIAELQENDDVKLPSLRQENIFGGKQEGDFFSDENPLANSNQFTLFLSNPPWVEPKKDEWLSSDAWAKKANIKLPRRNTAAAFMIRAKNCITPNGRVCLVLPVSVVAAPTSSAFLRDWLSRFRLKTFINFGDLRKLLFENAKTPCFIALAQPRADAEIGQIPAVETFEYWVPKADVSFAFGRLTLHSSDRHTLTSRAICYDNEMLTSLYWGTARDIATISELRLLGKLDAFVGAKAIWKTRKGFHRKDSSVEKPASSRPLRNKPFLDAKSLNINGPILDPSQLTSFPREIETVASLPDTLMEIFSGPKIVIPDGATGQRSIRAAYSNRVFSFSSSVAVIAGSPSDENLLRFLSVYLNSKLVQYVIMLTAYQVNFERERISLNNIKGLPFVHPDDHSDPERAWKIVKTIADYTREFEKQGPVLRRPFDITSSENLIYEYFGLDELQKARINEVATKVAPHLQPSAVLGLNTPLQQRPSVDQVKGYVTALRHEIYAWRNARGGSGDIDVQITTNSGTVCGALGIVRLEPTVKLDRPKSQTPLILSEDKAVERLLHKLNDDGLLPMAIQENLDLAADIVIRTGEVMYLIKPLISRLWLRSEASRDAERIVQSVLSIASPTGENA